MARRVSRGPVRPGPRGQGVSPRGRGPSRAGPGRHRADRGVTPALAEPVVEERRTDRARPTEPAEVDRVDWPAREARNVPRATVRRAPTVAPATEAAATVMQPGHRSRSRRRNRSATERLGSKWIGWKPAGNHWARRKRRSLISWVSPRTTPNSSCSASRRPGCSGGSVVRPGFRPGSGRWLPRLSEVADSGLNAGVKAAIGPPTATGVASRPDESVAPSQMAGRQIWRSSPLREAGMPDLINAGPRAVRAAGATNGIETGAKLLLRALGR